MIPLNYVANGVMYLNSPVIYAHNRHQTCKFPDASETLHRPSLSFEIPKTLGANFFITGITQGPHPLFAMRYKVISASDGSRDVWVKLNEAESANNLQVYFKHINKTF